MTSELLNYLNKAEPDCRIDENSDKGCNGRIFPELRAPHDAHQDGIYQGGDNSSYDVVAKRHILIKAGDREHDDVDAEFRLAVFPLEYETEQGSDSQTQSDLSAGCYDKLECKDQSCSAVTVESHDEGKQYGKHCKNKDRDRKAGKAFSRVI